MLLIDQAPRYLFFTGKGGVGKTSISCMVATALARRGKKVLLISTDPASNLDEVLETELSGAPTPVVGCPGLLAMNIDPEEAAAAYRERMVAPYRGVLPDEAVQKIEEQLSGACTVEIAAFNEFSQVIGQPTTVADYHHVVLDTAPTGHTLRLLSLPAAWNDFVLENKSGSSCLGPLAGLKKQRLIYEGAVASLTDPALTLLVLVSRPELFALEEAARAATELAGQGMKNQHLFINGLFQAASDDPVAKALEAKAEQALANLPPILARLPRSSMAFRPHGLVGMGAIDRALAETPDQAQQGEIRELATDLQPIISRLTPWPEIMAQLAAPGKGLIMTMGKGGVGKTATAAAIAVELARRGHRVCLSTTDPAAHVAAMLPEAPTNLTVSRIDPKAETRAYTAQVLADREAELSPEDLELLREELRSPCIEEIAVFQAFAREVASAREQFLVLDTAPTGHTLLLLDATESYHREVAKNNTGASEAVKELLPRLRDPQYTKLLLVTLPEATPVHEAASLQEDLRRAGIEPWGWAINQCFSLSGTRDPQLAARGVMELGFIKEVLQLCSGPVAASPWLATELKGDEPLRRLLSTI
ncbi:arsenical pump-driving ATPase [Desulfurivibrio alkaliphilus]|uniref:arsenite-transporting ATPase n=1 Tax=Desulfurivibrio alkaliphilus (strain DSM 19089 / UNIQEM U267 / AHT2) TaxID=589865 RepID=D6Z0Q7_DESAT|nr:arsenical pump-driving ATPase [Desulfurivibrio alkaliphilus]ADH85286.1 arsenite-activated ATPase ArsA [Desulfurivibrio alkaliphilus AHT 2]